MAEKSIVQKIVVGGVVLHEDKVLILQRHANETTYPNMWELPSGKREPLETSEQSLLREVKEEAGIDVSILLPFSVFEYRVEKDTEIRDSTQINFLVTSTHGTDVILSDEHQAYAWITPLEIDKYEISDQTKNVIRKAFELATLIEKK